MIDANLIGLLPEHVVVPARLPPDERLFVHAERPAWGVGLWVAEEETRRRVRFQDGEIRAFKKGFYHLLRPIDPDVMDADDLVEQLQTDHQRALQLEMTETVRETKPPVMSFEDQLRVFAHLYPKGFADETFIHRHRSRGGTKSRVLMDPPMMFAKERLSRPAMDAIEPSERPMAVYEAAVELTRMSNLVRPASRERLERLAPDKAAAFGEALTLMLHGDLRFRLRFDKWVATLSGVMGTAPTWDLCTMFLGLLRPSEHVCVKRRTFRLQGRAVAPRKRIGTAPTSRGYRAARRIAAATRKRLEAADLEPRDMLDVRLFMWETLRPKGVTVLAELS